MVPELKNSRVARALCAVKASPDRQSESTSELLHGETVQLLQHSTDKQWCRIQNHYDGYEGFVETSALCVSDSQVTHSVIVRATYIFEQADIKSRILMRVVFGSDLIVKQKSTCGRFLQLFNGGYIWADHCRDLPVKMFQSMVAIGKEYYLQAPYRWGGRSTDGCDCSGLVQMLARAITIKLPRDSGDQQAAIRNSIDFKYRQAEDLVFWPGHVGVLESPDKLLHATAHTMCCCVESLQSVIDRAGVPSAIKRLDNA